MESLRGLQCACAGTTDKGVWDIKDALLQPEQGTWISQHQTQRSFPGPSRFDMWPDDLENHSPNSGVGWPLLSISRNRNTTRGKYALSYANRKIDLCPLVQENIAPTRKVPSQWGPWIQGLELPTLTQSYNQWGVSTYHSLTVYKVHTIQFAKAQHREDSFILGNCSVSLAFPENSGSPCPFTSPCTSVAIHSHCGFLCIHCLNNNIPRSLLHSTSNKAVSKLL